MGCGGKQKEREFIRFAFRVPRSAFHVSRSVFRVPCFVFCVPR